MLTGIYYTICPPKTQFVAFNKTKSDKKTIFFLNCVVFLDKTYDIIIMR